MAMFFFSSCLDDGSEDTTNQWKEQNATWLEEQQIRKNTDGTDYYTRIEAVWNPQAYVLMHWHNNRALTQNNRVPLSNSTVDMKYILYNCKGVPMDSSYLRTSPADSIYRSRLNSNISGWVLAVTNMHEGDSCTVIIPYQQAYGVTGSTVIQPYSNLRFEMKLAGIPGYNTPVE